MLVLALRLTLYTSTVLSSFYIRVYILVSVTALFCVVV